MATRYTDHFAKGKILIVDDSDEHIMILSAILKRLNYCVETAYDGWEGLQKLSEHKIDLVMLDLNMPRLDGYETLKLIKKQPKYQNLPILILTAVKESDSVIQCMQSGASDYLIKPPNPLILKKRVEMALAYKYRKDQEELYMQRLEIEQMRTEHLLSDMLPYSIAARLKQGEETIADRFDCITVLFADIVHFTDHTSKSETLALVQQLNALFSEYDSLAEHYGIEKIKTIGDAYMAVGGAPIETEHHAQSMADFALALIQITKNYTHAGTGEPFQLRIGMCSGPAVAGVIGRYRLNYDFWGEVVNYAKRLEEYGKPDKILVSEQTYHLLQGTHTCYPYQKIDLKQTGEKTGTYFLTGRIPVAAD